MRDRAFNTEAGSEVVCNVDPEIAMREGVYGSPGLGWGAVKWGAGLVARSALLLMYILPLRLSLC